MKARWSQIHAVCRAVEAVAGRDIRCWVEDAGDVVAGERPERYTTPCTQRVGGCDEAVVLAGVDGRGAHAWIDLLACVVRTTLEQQTTIQDMASAAARTWRQMNALLSMASSSSLGLEPGKTIQRIFDMLVRATRFEGGIAIVRLPGSDECIQLDASGVARVPPDLLAGLESVREAVRTFAEGAEPDDAHRACSALLDPFKPAAIGRLQTDHELFGWLVAASADPLSSDDLKLFGAASRIIAVALENAHTLSLERETTRADVERELYGGLAKTAPVGMFRTDGEGRTLYVNDRWCSVTGASDGEALRDGWLCAVHEDDRARVTAEWERMLVESKPVRCEHRCRDEGVESWVLTEVAREAKEDGGFVGTMTDITDRKRAEQEKAELEVHLRHAHKMEAVGTMAGGIAKDFDNLLGAIVGNAELAIGRVPEGDHARVHLDRLLQGAFRARDLVGQMLAFSKQTESVRVPQEMGPVVEEALALIRAAVPSSIELRAVLSRSGCNVCADAAQLHQVVVNLCTNAQQAIGNAVGEVEVGVDSVELDAAAAGSLASSARAGRYARLSVVDSGPGVSEAVRGRIFEPFVTTKSAGSGSGLGLAVVHGIVTDHGGFVHVSNEPVRGARFEVYFPIHDARAGSERAHKAAAAWTARWGQFAGGRSQAETHEAPGLAGANESAVPASSSALVPRTYSTTPAAIPPVWTGPQADSIADTSAAEADNSLEDLVESFLAVENDPQAAASPAVRGDAANALVPVRAASPPAAPQSSAAARTPQPPRVLPPSRSALAAGAPADDPQGSPAETSDESLLERLVADFLATEESPVRRYGGATSSGAHAATHATVPARAGAQAGTLPAVRGHRVPARTRLLEHAPEVQRGSVKLLGSGNARRLEHGGQPKLEAAKPRALPAAPLQSLSESPASAARDSRVADAVPAEAPTGNLFFPFMIG